MTCEVAGHVVNTIGQILPRPSNAFDIGLAAQLSFGADFPGHACNFRGEGVELIHHRIDGVFQLQNFSAYFDGDLPRQIAFRDGRRHVGDIAHLIGEVTGHVVHAVREIFPGAADTFHLCLAAQASFCTHFAGHARNF